MSEAITCARSCHSSTARTPISAASGGHPRHDARDAGEALIKLDLPATVKMGAHPLVPFLAQLQMQRERRAQ